MFAIAFDLDTAETRRNHPSSVPQAYADIRNALGEWGFDWVQGSVYLTEREDLSNLFQAIQALKQLPWFPASVRDIRAFRVEQWSDFTAMVKRP
jgi:virulence-associated protein VapD